jgi:hypothetical protein
MPARRDLHSAMQLPSAEVLVAGGEDLANFAANFITRAQGGFAWAAAMLMAQAGHNATALHGGRVLLVG